MSPNARDRARAKRRYEKRQAKLAQRAQARRARQQIIGAVVAVAVIAVGAVALNHFVGSSGKNTAAKASTPTSTPTSTSTATTPAGQCPPGSNKPNANPLQFTTAPPKSLAANRTWTATLNTSCGPITISLDGKKAPQTVASFIYLARKGYFAKSPCHRLTTSGLYVLQCGDPSGTGNGTPGYSFGVENSPKSGDYPAGTLAMARTSDPKSNGSQFFIVYKDTQLPTAGGTGYTIFGKVTTGLAVVTKIAASGVADGSTDGVPATPIDITSVSVK